MRSTAGTASPTVTCRHASKTFGDERAVDDLELDVEGGTIHALIGPSGGGKTTSVRLMTGVLRPDSGSVRALGHDPAELSPRQRRRLGYMPQIPALAPELSAWENLRFTAAVHGLGVRRRRRLHEVLDFVGLDEHRRKRVDELSGGMQRRLALAATLVHEPDLLFLDEPTAGIDPILRQRFWDRFTALRDAGRTLVVTTQYIGEARYCDRVGLLAGGRLIADDTPSGLRRSAYGGELIDVTTAGMLTEDDLVAMASSPDVGASRCQRTGPDSARLVVDDAAERLPQLLRWMDEHSVAVASCEQRVPDLEDVFVELVKADEADRHEDREEVAGDGVGQDEAASDESGPGADTEPVAAGRAGSVRDGSDGGRP